MTPRNLGALHRCWEIHHLLNPCPVSGALTVIVVTLLCDVPVTLSPCYLLLLLLFSLLSPPVPSCAGTLFPSSCEQWKSRHCNNLSPRGNMTSSSLAVHWQWHEQNAML